MNDKDYKGLEILIRKLLGIDLTSYKEQQMRRRIDCFIAAQRVDVPKFVDALPNDTDLQRKLREFITINVSEFFRDNEPFTDLEKRVLPDLLKSGQPITVWSAGCSNGSEPFSVSMLLDELSPGRGHKVLATDLDQVVLARARAGGPYAPADVRNVTKSRIGKYFDEKDNGYFVKDRVKGMVDFRQHDLLKDPYPNSLNLAMCRNVMIYFTDDAKKNIFRNIFHSLKDNGVLFIGATEALFNAKELGFERVSNTFYRKHAAGAAVA